MYKDRQGRIIDSGNENNFTLEFLYTTAPGRFALKYLIEPWLSNLIRFFLTTKASSLLIDRFIKKNGISMKDYLPERYESFNDFFTRPIKPARRPFCRDANLFSSPCDGKVSVYDITPELVMRIKNTDYSVKSLVRSREIAEEYAGGYCVVIRLSVDNYHHYAYPDNAVKTDDIYLPGVLHTVRPIALENVSVFAENTRVYTLLDTEHFGLVVQMEVGAIGVGRIDNWDDAGPVVKGDEKGMFEFGGSTVVLLLKKDHFIPDEDLVKNTAEGFETLVKMGERIGCNEKYQG